MRNRQFVFAPKIEYQLVAERGEANLQNLQFPQWYLLVKIRTYFDEHPDEE